MKFYNFIISISLSLTFCSENTLTKNENNIAVEWTSPSIGQTDVLVTTDIQIGLSNFPDTFDSNMVAVEAGETIHTHAFLDSSILVIIPLSPLPAETEVNVIILKSLGLKDNYFFNFFTSNDKTQFLSLTAIAPADSAVVSANNTQSLHYRANYDINPASVDRAFSLRNLTDNVFVATTVINVSGKDIYVQVSGLLETGKEYEAKFSSRAIRGTEGQNPFTHHFFYFSTSGI